MAQIYKTARRMLEKMTTGFAMEPPNAGDAVVTGVNTAANPGVDRIGLRPLRRNRFVALRSRADSIFLHHLFSIKGAHR